jgi:hypothetical protein
MFTLNNKKIEYNLILIFIIFFFTRIVSFFFFEIRPNDDFSGAWQVLNPQFLKNNLSEAILYLIFQPPLYNLIIGIVFKFFENISSVSLFFYFFNIIITIFILIITFRLCKIYRLSNTKTFLLLLLTTVNPSIYFYETNAPNYESIACFILILQFFLFIKYFKKYSFKLLIFIYFNFLILTYLWSAFTPIILIIFFGLDLFANINLSERKKKNIFIFILFFFISLLPAIKNFFLFDYFNSGSLGIGMQIGPTTSSIKNDFSIHNECSVIVEDKWNQFYYKKYNLNTQLIKPYNLPTEKFNNFNTLGRITKSEYCTKKSLNYIKDNFILYILARSKELIISHTQFAVDHSFTVGHPKNFEKIKNLLKELHNHNNPYKKIKQFILMSFFLFIYFIIGKRIIVEKKKYLKYSYICVTLLYFYFLAVATLFSQYEGARFIHTFYIIQLIFWLIFLSQSNSRINIKL